MKSSYRYRSLGQALLLYSSICLAADHCPRLHDIVHTPGEYSWSSKLAGWEGAFVAPSNGLGYSTDVKRFIQARWIQFSNLPKSAGYIQCDYAGNKGTEVIRFTQKNHKATHKPHSPYWTKSDHLHFPSVQASCNASVTLCQFHQL